MKKLLLMATLISSTLSFSQIQNLGFENWSNNTPDGWQAPLGLFAQGSVTQITTGAPEGSSAVQLSTVDCFICGFLGLPSVAPGLMQQQTSFVDRPNSVSVKLKCNIGAGDEALFGVITSLYSPIDDTSYTVGIAGTIIPGGTIVNNWTTQTLQFQYQDVSNPDTIVIVAASSDSLLGISQSSQYVGSTLSIDAIVFNYPAGISEVFYMNNDVILYPNPASDFLTIKSKNGDKAKSLIYDISGRLISTDELIYGVAKIDLTKFENGLYICKVIDENNKIIFTDKFTVSK
jgi:hypothetical protein